LFFIAIPSFALLYAIEEMREIEGIIKVIGNQWYWTYETPLPFSIKEGLQPLLQ
jgi:heme/copper-type cytochrome/quinol oxidase subunit 2